jgi:integrase
MGGCQLRRKIAQRVVERLAAPATGSRIEYDKELPGFGVRITAAGAISFVLNYHIHGRERRYTIGRWPEWSADAARNEAQERRREIRNGKDPLEQLALSRSERTMSDLAEDYMENYAEMYKRPASVRDDRNMLKSTILPKFGQMGLSAIGRRDIESLHHSLKGTPYKANRVLSLLSKMFAQDKHKFKDSSPFWSDNPAKGVPRYHEDKREFWLTNEQLDELEKALNSYPVQDSANAIRLLIWTGSREGEVLKAMWTEFDLKRGFWTKPSHHTKQKKVEQLPLSTPALTLLNKMAESKTGDYLFPGSGRRVGNSRVSLRRAWMQVCKAASLAREIKVPGKRTDKTTGQRKELTRYRPMVRIHDLRHTYASHLVSHGESLYVVQRLLGHTQSKTTERYAKLADVALRKATEHFGEIRAGKPA